MNNIKFQFSIKDLENFSGIKAHTIRIWEKRYEIFNPNRTETNIRFYSLEDFKKLLNISYLTNYGYKISRISKLSENEINSLVKQIYAKNTNSIYTINILKLAMLNFDAVLFNETHNEVAKTKNFSQIFLEIYKPFLYEIGILWQTSSIKPIHEHFISNLIYQKLIENISILQVEKTMEYNGNKYILFLPENELHEISLMFINYQLISKGYKTIYLGSSVPFSDLLEISKLYDNVNFVSCFTVMPLVEDLNDYLLNFSDQLLNNSTNKLVVLGNQTQYITSKTPSIIKFSSMDELIISL